MKAKFAFLGDLIKYMQQDPKLVLFYYQGVPIYTFTKLEDVKEMYELLHLKSKRYLQLRSSSWALPRLRSKLYESLAERIDKVEILFEDDTTQTFVSDDA